MHGYPQFSFWILIALAKISCSRIVINCAKILLYYAPINSKLQHPPPRAYPGHLTVHRARGGGNLNAAFEGWGI